MAQMYRFERNGVIKFAELIEQNDKAKTVTLKLQDGTLKATMLSTFKRWWKPCDDVVTEQEQPEEEAQQDNEEQQDNVVNEEVSNADIKNDAVEKKAEKEKKEKKEKKAKKDVVGLTKEERTKVRDELLAKLSEFDSVTATILWNDPLWINVRVDERKVFGIGLTHEHIRIRAIQDFLPKDIKFKEVQCVYNAVVFIDYKESDTVIDLIKYIIDNFAGSEVLKLKKKAKKKEEKEEQANG